jgi:hypothetical protein
MNSKKPKDEYSDEEAEKQLQAALPGSRITGHKQTTDIPEETGDQQAGSFHVAVADAAMLLRRSPHPSA